MKFDSDYVKFYKKLLGGPPTNQDSHSYDIWQAAQAAQRKKSVIELRKLKYRPEEVMAHKDFQRFRNYNKAIEHAAKELEKQ